jgi:glycerol uptake facilitator-like aquaporin
MRARASMLHCIPSSLRASSHEHARVYTLDTKFDAPNCDVLWLHSERGMVPGYVESSRRLGSGASGRSNIRAGAMLGYPSHRWSLHPIHVATMNVRAILAEFVGTALLLLAIVGSGIMAQRLCGGNIGLALLANAIATGGALIALILAFGPISGAHFNPAVTLADAWQRGVPWSLAVAYIAAQLLGALAGTALADGMFGLPLFFPSHHERSGLPLTISEFVATFGLLATIWGCARSRPAVTPFAVAAFIVGAYWFTPSTSFANPAVTIARSLTDTFAGIRPADAPLFIAAQLLGALAATALFAYLVPISKAVA